MSNFSYDYKTELFGCTVFVNESGELDVVNPRTEILMTDRYTGKHQKVNLKDLVNMIKIVFPDKEEQKQLLLSMFCDE